MSSMLSSMFRARPWRVAGVALAVATPLGAQDWLDAPRYVTEPNTGELIGVGDSDGDGDADLLFAEATVSPLQAWTYTGFRVERNDGAGTFTRGPTQALPASSGHLPIQAPLVDVTGDGFADVLVARAAAAGGDAVLVYAGLAGGAFGAPHVLALAGPFEHVAFGDADGDGVMELAIEHRSSPGPSAHHVIRWWDHAGATFVPSAAVVVPGFLGSEENTGVYSMIALEFTGDGRADLAVGPRWKKAVLLLPTIHGAPTPGPEIRIDLFGETKFQLIAADADLDGDDDVIVASDADPLQILVLSQTAPGTFATGPETLLFNPSAGGHGGTPRFAADWDGDGDLDLLAQRNQPVATGWSTLTVIENRAALGFAYAALVATGPKGAREGAGAADFNGDGHADFAAAHTTYFGTGSLQDVHVGSGAGAALDWDGDGDADFVSRDVSPGAAYVHRNDGTGTFAPIAPLPIPFGNPLQGSIGTYWSRLTAVGDFDAAHGTDLLIELREIHPQAGMLFHGIHLWLNDAKGGFTYGGRATQLPLAADATAMLPAGDVDDDGDDDLFAVQAGVAGWFESTGSAALGTFHALFPGEVLRAFDLEGDGDLDVFTREGSALVLRRRDGPSTWTPFVLATPAAGGFGADAIDGLDLDADGDLDVVIGGVLAAGAQSLRVIENLVNVAFVPKVVLAVPNSVAGRCAAFDVDHDGVRDLVVSPGLSSSDRILVHRGLGGLAFAPPVAFVNTGAATFADVDGDGDPDAAGTGGVRLRAFDGPDDGILRQYAAGTVGSAGATPLLGGTGPVRPGSTTASIRVRAALGGAPALFVIGTAESAIPKFGLPHLTLLASPILTIVPLSLAGPLNTPVAGTLDFSTVPTLALVAGLSIYHQVFVLDPGAPGGVASSNGFEIVYGI